jgi:hypothetical protein
VWLWLLLAEAQHHVASRADHLVRGGPREMVSSNESVLGRVTAEPAHTGTDRLWIADRLLDRDNATSAPRQSRGRPRLEVIERIQPSSS